MGKADEHPEQNPAEDSRKTIERDLNQPEDKRRDRKGSRTCDVPEASRPGSEAAEPSSGS